MEIFLYVLFFAIGLVLIVKGGDWFVDASSWIAEVFGVPQFIIGATIVSVATTLPEILVSCIAASEHNVGLAIGNAVGSVNANVALIMAISLICMPTVIKRKDYLAKGLLLIGGVTLLILLCLPRTLNMWLSLLLLIVFISFIVENIVSMKRNQNSPSVSVENSPKGEAAVKTKPAAKVIVKNTALFIFGAAGIVVGARLLVDTSSFLAGAMGIPDAVIGVTIVAVGTSLPELVTAIVSIVKKNSELSVGNIIGANIIDITLILPLCAIINGGALPVSAQSLYLDMPFCLLAVCLAVIPALITKKFNRWQGFALLAIYIAYLVTLFVVFI